MECYKCEKKEHKCRECPLWRKKKQVERKLVYLVKGKVQETERKIRRTKEDKVACMARP